ncbi:MAG: Rap1a/Tai family immunity protein [Stellaceae bacterium]
MFAGLRIIAVVAAVVLSCGFAVAKDAVFSANDLMAGCRAYLVKNISTEDYFAAKYCAQIIDGIIGAERGICLPVSSTEEQAAGIVVKYIDARPARLHENFEKLAREALRAAFPCKR